MNKILTIGSSGMLGKPVTKELIKTGFDVKILTRNIPKTQQLFPAIENAEGNVFDKKSLANAMEDREIVYINLSIQQDSKKTDPQQEKEGVDNIIAAARETGIKRIAYLSSLIKNYNGMKGFSWWAFDIKLSAINKIKNSGIPFTIYYPSSFMETFPFQMIRGNKIMMIGQSVAPMWFIAAEDYAKQVAKSFQLAGMENKEYSVQGPEPFTFDEAARVIISNYARSNLKVMKAPMGILKFLGLFNPRLNYGTNICDALNKYPEKFESEKTWQELGKPSITLAEFAKSL